MRKIHPLLAFALVLTSVSPIFCRNQRPLAEARVVARRALARSIVIDTHADTPQMMLDEGYDLAENNSPYMISLPKMRAAHWGAEFFSIWVDVDWPRQDLIHRALDLIDAVDEQVARHPDSLALAGTADDIERIHREGRIAVLMGLEGGHILQDDPRMLDIFYRLGVRYMTLTHTRNTAWADSSGDKPQHNGLTDVGRQVVERMNRLGMIVDISHVSDKTFYDAIAASKAPLLASHSSCRALCNAPRDMSDDMIRTLASHGGVIDINYYNAFLDPAFAAALQKVSGPMEAAVTAARQKKTAQGKRLTYAEETKIRMQFVASIPAPSFTVIADHIDHAVEVGGIDHVGLGSDFDGVDGMVPRGFADCSKLPDLVVELARRGYSEAELEKILGGNVLRLMRQVESTAHSMQVEKR